MALPKRLKKHYNYLKVISEAKPKLRGAIIKQSDPDLIICLAECADNILKGNIPLQPKHIRNLKKYKCPLRTLADKHNKLAQKRELLIQKGGFLPLLLTPILSVAGSLLTDIISKNATR